MPSFSNNANKEEKKIFANVFLECGAASWNELLTKPIFPNQLRLSEVARSFAYFCDDRRLVANDKTRSNKKISVYKCQACSWRVKFVKRNRAVAKGDPWYLDSWGTAPSANDASPSQHGDRCHPVQVLQQGGGDILRNSRELREFLVENRQADKAAITAFMMTRSIDISKMSNGPLFNARNNILRLLEDVDFLTIVAHGGDSASSSETARQILEVGVNRGQPGANPEPRQQASAQDETPQSTSEIVESVRVADSQVDMGACQPNDSAVSTPQHDPMDSDVMETERSVSSSSFSSILHSIDISHVSSYIFIDDSPSADSNQESHGHHHCQAPTTSAPKRDNQPRQVPQDARNTENAHATPAANSEYNDDSSTSNIELNTTDSGGKKKRNEASNHSLLNSISSRIGAVSISNGSSIGTYAASNESMLAPSGSSIKDMTNDLEVKEKHGRTGNTIHSEPLAQKVRFSLSNHAKMDEAKRNCTKNEAFALDSPVAVVCEGMSVLGDEMVLTDGVQAVMDTTRELSEGHREVYALRQSETETVVTHAESTQSATLTNREIAFKSDNMSAETGLGNIGGMSPELMLNELNKPFLGVNTTKWLLDELSNCAVNQDKQLMDDGFVDCVARAISTVIGRRLKDKIILLKAFICVIQLYGNHGTRSMHASHDLVAQTLRVLNLYHYDTGLLHHGLSLLQTLIVCSGFNAKHAIVKANGIELFLKRMRRHLHHAGIQSAGCYLLGYVARSNINNQCTIVDFNGISFILHDSMQRHKQDEDVQYYGCFALCSLAENHIPNQRTMREANGLEIIQQAMQQFPRNGLLNTWGGNLVKWLQREPPGKARNRGSSDSSSLYLNAVDF